MSAARIERCIHLIRGQRIMLDADLAPLYGVSTRVLTQAVRRNRERFPGDFLFQLVADEVTILRSQTVISSLGHGGRRYRPYAFTEQGIAMLSSVLRSRRAIRVNVEIMRAFVRLRRIPSGRARPSCNSYTPSGHLVTELRFRNWSKVSNIDVFLLARGLPQ